MAEVIHRAMAVSRKQRPISAAEMRKALRYAVEEDERHSAEEEYRRAEERRRERDEQGGKAKPNEVDSALEEAKTRKKKAPAEQERKREISSHRSEPHAAIPETLVGATVRAPEPPLKAQPPVMETLHAPAPERVSFGQLRPGANETYQSQTVPPRSSKRGMIVGIALLALVLVGGGIVWIVIQSAQKDVATKTQAGQPNAQGDASAVSPAEGMVNVPGGTFTMGLDATDGGDDYERPAHQVTVKPFLIDKYEVTNEDYEKFVKATSHRAPSTWKNGSFASGAARKPVTGVTWDDANDYARWAGKRLPTEQEWEFAARGADGRRYPWGKDWQPGMANANAAAMGLSDVGAFKGASPYGAYDMVGNAWEWTASDFRAYPGGTLPGSVKSSGLRVIRGGSYESSKAYATTTYRTGWPARGAKTYDQTGFRCVKDVQ